MYALSGSRVETAGCFQAGVNLHRRLPCSMSKTLDRVSARRAIDSLACRPLLDGVRGAAPSDVEAVVDAVAALASLAQHLGDLIGELDINPLIAGPQGCIAVDALVVARGQS